MSIQHSRNRTRSVNNPDTNPATSLLAEDADGYFEADFRYLNKKKHYQHLKELNAGRNISLNWYNERVFTFEMACDKIDTLSAQLDLTSKERGLAKRHYISLDREKLGLESTLVAYCVCAYVIENNDKNEHRRYHPNLSDEKKDELFGQIAESLDLCQKDIVKTYGKIQNWVDETPPPVPERDVEHHLLGDEEGGGI
jgi:hypothetical protein